MHYYITSSYLLCHIIIHNVITIVYIINDMSHGAVCVYVVSLVLGDIHTHIHTYISLCIVITIVYIINDTSHGAVSLVLGVWV